MCDAYITVSDQHLEPVIGSIHGGVEEGVIGPVESKHSNVE